MKNSRYLVAGLVAAVICAFAVSGTAQQTLVSAKNGIPAPGSYEAFTSLTARQANMRRALDSNTTIVPWLLEQAATGDMHERESAIDALAALAPIAASEFINGLGDKNPAVRETAMDFLPLVSSANPNFPLDKAISLLLKIAQDEGADEAFRKHARMTIYRIVGASQGVEIRRPPA